MRLRLPGLVLLLALPTVAAGAADPATNAGPVDFDRDVRPILAQHCYECHGPDKSKGGLRLDQATAIGRPGKSGKVAITAGHADQSELIRRVTTTDADDRMPPEKERLTSVQVATLGSWIDQGAKFETHWAYRPIARPAPPTVKDERWVRGDIDRFVLATLEARMIAPSPEADRRTLIKRLSYDLVGLPPDPADVVTFVADASPDAYEKLIDRLLASPHFGERWARHWLDLARYADSDGYEKDSPRPDAWRYRDWVIDAINRDVPFDQFTVEQLAGDLLPNATYSQKLATAFHRQTLTNKEGGVDQEQFRVEATFDRAETTGTVWLGLTVGCARCHTHKYDAITHAEYYQLFAFFNDADEADIPVSQAAPTPGQSARATPEAPPRIPPNANPAKPVAKTAAAAKNSVRVMAQRPAPRDTHILSRGDFLRPEA
ncbi:MAG TPA: DUF1549 domain-containing protein, partial [Tepidisphaeraceae bacterium]|nr:DUF1549 domain-containing protein [Tepidisphaeraceae bacterium]